MHVIGTRIDGIGKRASFFWVSWGLAVENGGNLVTTLITASQFADPDAAYVALVDARRGLSEPAAAAFDARLVLVLANHIGDLEVLQQAIAAARRDGQ